MVLNRQSGEHTLQPARSREALDRARSREALDRARSREALDRAASRESSDWVFWLSLTLVSLSVFVPKFLPLTDYPQHLGLADVARRLQNPSAPEHQYFQLNLFTYNGLFHILTAKIGALTGVFLAGKIVVSASLFIQGVATRLLLLSLGRPKLFAVLFIPFLFAFSLAFGFVNFTLGMAIVSVTLLSIVKSIQSPHPLFYLASIFLGQLCAFTHVLAMLILCAFSAAIAPEVALLATRGKPILRRAWETPLRALTAGLPLLFGCYYCILVYREQYAWNPAVYKDPGAEGTAPPMLEKLIDFPHWATGLYPDRSDKWTLYAVFLFFAFLVGQRIYNLRKPSSSIDPAQSSKARPILLPFVVLFSAYLVVPAVSVGTHFVFPRLAQPVVLALLLALPAGEALVRSKKSVVFAAIVALGSALNLVAHMAYFAYETNDFYQVMAACPEGRRASSVIHSPDVASFLNRPLTHAAGYYGALKNGDWAYNFAHYQSVPVIFRAGGSPPWPQKSWELEPLAYAPRSNFARYYDLLFVKAPDGMIDERAVRQMLFGQDQLLPEMLSHHGQFWAFDTAKIAAEVGAPRALSRGL